MDVNCEDGHTYPEAPEIFFGCRAAPLFLALQVQLVVLVSAFVMVITVWSVSYLLFFYSRCPPPRAQSFVKVGGTCPVPRHHCTDQLEGKRFIYKSS